MRCLSLIFVLFMASLSMAEKDNVFEDAELSELVEEPMEYDADFDDSEFAGIENEFESGFESGSSLASKAKILTDHGVRRSEKSLSVFTGNEIIGRVFHWNIFPQGHFEVWKIEGHIGLPLRFPIYDNASKSAGFIGRKRGFLQGSDLIKPRGPDFQSPFDIQRAIRHFAMGTEQDPYSLSLSRTQAYSLAEGDLMQDMVGEGLYDQDYLFAHARADLERLQLESVVGPLLKPNIIAANASFQPLSSLNVHSFVKELSVDLSYAGDFFAPMGPVAKNDDSFVLDNEQRLILREEGNVQSFSTTFASSYQPVQWFAMKPYLSYSHLFLNDLEGDQPVQNDNRYGTGGTLGHLMSFYFNEAKDSALSLRTELRLFSQNFEPHYFGGNYMLDRQSYRESGLNPISKAHYVGFDNQDSARYGYNLELAYALNTIFSSKLGFEEARLARTNEIIAPLRQIRWINKININDLMSLYLAYQATSLSLMKELFDFEKSRGLLSLRGQIKLMQFLYVDSWLKHGFGIKDKYQVASGIGGENAGQWLSTAAEERSLNFGLGVEFAMTF